MEYIIIGGGPAGLTFANKLLQEGEKDFIVLEACEEVGGLCRSKQVDNSPLDIGGGHFLDVKNKKALDFFFGFMPESEWDRYERDSRIFLRNRYVHHPIEANIFEFDIDSQVAYLESIAQAGCNTGVEKPDRFKEWCYWKLGERIAEDYMIPYNNKMFGEYLDELGVYWLEKLPDVSFADTIRSCLEHVAHAKQPGHAKFYYPKKHGYGELWNRMGEALGNRLICEKRIKKLDIRNHYVETEDGLTYEGRNIITTIPWKSYDAILGLADEIRESIHELKHTSIYIEYIPKNYVNKAHWVYYPQEDIAYHRILARENFVTESKGYWTETNAMRFNKNTPNVFFYNEYAYPVNTANKLRIMDRLLSACRKQGVYGLGRWGEHKHYNSDVVADKAMTLCEQLERA